jgi:hypothetical protein
MTDGRGGYRRPSSPAAVSGPGRLSQRTDGGPAHQQARYIAGLEYGAGQETMDLQQAAPLSAALPAPAPPPPGADAVPFGAPTQRPDEPVTAGAPFGPGPGPPEPSQVHLPPDILVEAARMAWIANPSSESLRLLETAEMIERSR